MSFDVFLQSFRDGDASAADGDAALELLWPRIVDRGDRHARIETSDGGAEIYGVDDPSSGLMVTHADGRQVWDLVYDLAVAGGYTVMPVGCPTCVTSGEARDKLPEGVPQPVIVIASGADLMAAITSQ